MLLVCIFAEIIMTPSKKGKATHIQIERRQKLQMNGEEPRHHVAGGEHRGLVVNKSSQGKTERKCLNCKDIVQSDLFKLNTFVTNQFHCVNSYLNAYHCYISYAQTFK